MKSLRCSVMTCVLSSALSIFLSPEPLLALELSQEQKSLLIERAMQAREKAYAPYSKFSVGAALLTEEGEIYSGCNVENGSYGLTCCAERVALFNAVSQGARQISGIAVAIPGGGSPCGACRQVLNEFNPSMQVILLDEQGHIGAEVSLDWLLPAAFTFLQPKAS